MKNIALISILGGLVFTLACEDLVTNVDLPEASDKLVINTFLTPDHDTNFIWITESKGYFGGSSIDQIWLDDVDVFISDENTTLQLSYDSQSMAYFVQSNDMVLMPGGNYTVLVKDDNGRQAEGETVVPLQTSHNIQLESIKLLPGDYEDEYNITVSFQDPVGKGDFYRLELRTEHQDTVSGFVGTSFPYLDSRSPFFDDANLDGNKISVTFKDPLYFGGGNKLKRVLVHLLVTDETYFKFHRSLDGHQNTADNPFVEPTLVYTNVENGLGVVSSYVTDVADFYLP